MSPQQSNRSALLEAALDCVSEMPVEQISARVLAAASGANLASIGYHFGSKDELLTAAVVAGLDRWLDAIAARLSDIDDAAPAAGRFAQAAEALETSRSEHLGVARAFVVALGRGLHDAGVAASLSEGFLHTRPRVAELLGLGSDDVGTHAGAVVHAMFVGLLVQSLLDEQLGLEPDQLVAALRRVADTLAGG